MISICNIRDVSEGQFNEVWAIVRFYRGKSPWINQVVDLSPSQKLWGKFNKLKLDGRWNEETFRSEYLPVFLKEMRSEAAREKLNELYKKDKAGRSIALVCFCKEENLCHRSIIAGILQGVGCNVHTATGNDYSKYYAEYMQNATLTI